MRFRPSARTSGGQLTELFATSGSGNVIDDVLGTLDPTLLSNSVYDVRLFAQDTNGHSRQRP